MKKALVVLSGGQDSTTCMVWAKARQYEVHAITFDYDQRHRREIKAAHDLAHLLGAASHEVIKLGPILQGTSPLTNPAEALETYGDFKSMDAIIGDRVEKTFVPMRNALFLTIAANRAVCLGADVIVTGVCQADNANYPDCRAKFVKQQGKAINYALGHDTIKQLDRSGPWIWIEAPLMNMSKAQSIHFMLDLDPENDDDVPSPKDPGNLKLTNLALLAFSHTAYDGLYPPKGNDHATILRAQGFVEAGLPDPLVIRAFYEGLMPLPESDNYSNAAMNARLFGEIQELQRRLGAQ